MDGEPKKFNVSGVFLTFFAIAVLALAGYFIFRYLTSTNLEDLKTNGKLLQTTFSSIEINWNLTINKQHPYQIHSVYVDPETEEVYYFKSKNLWSNPDGYVPKMIPVYVDPANYKNYWMDLSVLGAKNK